MRTCADAVRAIVDIENQFGALADNVLTCPSMQEPVAEADAVYRIGLDLDDALPQA